MNSFKIALRLSKGDKTEFDVPVEAQRSFLGSFPNPVDDYERSYFQYKCQSFFSPKWKILLYNFLSIVLYIPTIFILFLNRLLVYKEEKKDAVGEFKGLEEVLPDELISEYSIDNEAWAVRMSLGIGDIPFVLSLLQKYPLHPYFSLKCLMKLAMYSSMIKKYRPRAVIVHNEYSYTSSVLTCYCNKRGITHINAMHGDKYFFIRDAFFHYDRCYVWDDYYVDLFRRLRAAEGQYFISTPRSLKINTDIYKKEEDYADYKYYLNLYNEREIKKIVDSMDVLYSRGMIVKFRPHPRYSDIELLKKYVPSDKIEDPYKVDIIYSISNTGSAVGICSTVLLQAYTSGKNVVLDDISNPNQYSQLVQLEYILSNKSLPTLSSIIAN